MAIRIHGSARTTPRIRAELQIATGSNRALAKRYGINVKTVAKWRSRSSVQDQPMGPRDRGSRNLHPDQERQVVELRRRGRLPLDDLMGHLLEQAPTLSRSALYRCLQRHGISRLPTTQNRPTRGKFEDTPIGFVHIDSAEMKIAGGKQHMFVAVDRVAKFTHVAFFDRATKANGAQFMRQVINAFPYRIHTVLTDNGVAFTEQERYRGGVTHAGIGHIFERVCFANGIKQKRTKPYHAWTNGMVERMNRTIKDATIKAYEYSSMEQLRTHVLAFVQSYNFGKHLKALRWKTPFRAICDAWSKDPNRFKLHPHHLTAGLNT
ncbi:IS481 family transposase [Paraburkholderia dinghuensis]|uniref:IS481 family transposase n=1 Tax=Paraburkholderia dinghuensis TaxID=2305225 RepID=A0A3N6MX39_9BURK|nr:IS481 family transposase [Paraburkholderia dinghuensis]RQH08319.1 IS481 family transposase [Paraburkholderia dinghuensis]